jgi:DNA-binding NtrC family response regulator
VNVRVISATNRDLEREVNKGSFRGDLYFRIAVVSVRVPALRERTEDLPHLIRAFLVAIGAEASEHLFQPLMEELATHEWPGNVRELRNYVERSVVLQTANLSMPPPSPAFAPAGAPEGRSEGADVRIPFKVAKDALIDRFERAYIRAALDASGGNMTKAARLAGIDRMYLHRLVQKHGSRDQLSSASSPSDPASAQQRKPVE